MFRITVDADLIMSLRPCADWPEERVRAAVPDRIGVATFLAAAHIPPVDRLWVVIRIVFLENRALRLFACDCAERALQRERAAGREPDARSWAAVDVARRYACGEATSAELDAARAAADNAIWSTTWGAAGAGSWAITKHAAWSTTRNDARDAAWSAAGADVRAAARVAAGDAEAEREWQCKRLATVVEAYYAEVVK